MRWPGGGGVDVVVVVVFSDMESPWVLTSAPPPPRPHSPTIAVCRAVFPVLVPVPASFEGGSQAVMVVPGLGWTWMTMTGRRVAGIAPWGHLLCFFGM